MNLRERIFGARSVAAGAAMYVTLRWFDRGIGLLSTIILARLLTPDDFGVVALATIVIGLAGMMLDFGIGIRIVQMPEVDRKDYDTAWTLRFLQNLLVAAVLVLAVPFVADYYHDPRVQPVLQLMAASIVIGSLGSMGVAVFLRERQYAREVAFGMSKRLFTFLVTLLLAFLWRDYWALVYGTFIGNIFGVLLSYWMYPVLRFPTLARWRKFVGASVWLTVRSLGAYASMQIDKLFVGRIGGSPALGAYTLADQIGAMPSTELLAPINRALFPAFAQKQGKPAELRQAAIAALGVQTLIAMPASVGVALVSQEVVQVLLGEKWLQVIPLLTLLALCYGLNSLSSVFSYLLFATGRFRAQALVYSGNCLLLVAVFGAFADHLSISDVAAIRIGAAAVLTAALIALGMRAVAGFRLADCLRAVWRPLLASAVMAACVAALGAWAHNEVQAIMLVAKVAVGALSYCAALFLLWAASGRPQGAESRALGIIRRISGIASFAS